MTPRTNTLLRGYVNAAIYASKIIGKEEAAKLLIDLNVPYHVVFRTLYDTH